MWITSEWSPFASPARPVEGGLRVTGQLRGVEAAVTFDLSLDQHRKRAPISVGAILDPWLLRELSELPGIEWVHLTELTPNLLNIADGRPELIETQLDSRGTWIRRRVEPPTIPTHVDIISAHWRQGLEWAGRFAGYASRTLHLTEAPRSIHGVALECAYYGVGLTVSSPEEVVVTVAAPFMPERFTPASWHFAEQIYARWLEAEAKEASGPGATKFRDRSEPELNAQPS